MPVSHAAEKEPMPSPTADVRSSIVLLIRSLFVGGAERQLVALARGLAARGHRVTVLTFYSGGPLEADLVGTGVELVCVDKKGRWETLAFFWRLAHRLRQRRPDTIYTFLSASNVIAALIKPAIPSARLVWGVRASDMDLSRYDWLARLIWRVECLLSGIPAKVIANSVAGRRYAIAHGFPADRVVVIPNGIDTERFRPDPARRVTHRQQWNIPVDAQLVGTVARLDPIKDHSTFLHAAKYLADEHPSAYFVCVGDGLASFRRELQELASSLGIADRVLWTAEHRDMTAAYNALDLFCSSSYSEGFSNTIAEAMACGIGCVVTDVGDSAHLVGPTGLVVPRSDPRALATAMSHALRGGVDGPVARARIIDLFSMQAMTLSSEAELGHGPPLRDRQRR